MTYNELKTAIQQYLMVEYVGDGAEPTFVANIDNFIKNTEIIINNTSLMENRGKIINDSLVCLFMMSKLRASHLIE
jgi:hypothetical protein